MSSQGEAAAARAAAALFRRPECGLLEVTGADRARWLDGMLTNAVTTLAPGREGSGCPALLLTRTGRIVADPHVLALEAGFWLDVSREELATTRETLERYIVADRVELRDASPQWERLAIEGPAAPRVLEAALGEPFELAAYAGAPCELAGAQVVVAATGFTAVARQIFVPSGSGEAVVERLLQAGADFGLVEAGGAALEILRIEAGVPRLGIELDETVLPAEANLEHAISFTKGCYTGQEIVTRLQSRGSASHRLVGLAFEAAAPAEVGAPIADGERSVGELTSACVSPAAGAIGLGFVRAASAEPGTRLRVGAAATTVAPLPFVA
ncbi:MAG: aminomethyltransferase family protein [Deltaproteobacteria bacterium]|nr:aminomethyltransferase family protein [Deltaproteobacteria bacterium]